MTTLLPPNFVLTFTLFIIFLFYVGFFNKSQDHCPVKVPFLSLSLSKVLISSYITSDYTRDTADEWFMKTEMLIS